MLNALCTFAAIALAIFSFSQAYAEVNRLAADTVMTGSTSIRIVSAPSPDVPMPPRPGF
ncbi:hypothetical protein [Devosia sp.]|uniref:hypothetical protein n=1 Tax=Devosia sp. TaxID=1871048 RepID=UPI003A92AB99